MNNSGYTNESLMDSSGLPSTLEDAQRAISLFPGAHNYLAENTEDKETLLADNLIEDVFYQIDAENMGLLITNNLGWSENESSAFFAHPKHQLFQSKIELASSHDKRLEQFSILGRYLFLKYQELKQRSLIDNGQNTEVNEQVQEARTLLFNFYYSAINNLFAQEYFDIEDLAYGITNRSTGNVSLTPELTEEIRDYTQESALKHGDDFEDVFKQVLDATENGNCKVILSFLLNRKGTSAVREVLERILVKHENVPEVITKKLQLLEKILAFSLEIGIDHNLFLELLEMPDSKTVEEGLTRFLTNPDLTSEVLGHLEVEAPNSYSILTGGQSISYLDVLTERANRANFPDTVETVEEISAKINRVWNKIIQLFPLSQEESPLNYVYSPLNLGATTNPISIGYYNKDGEIVSVIILNPRDNEELFEEVLAEELIHKLHMVVLERAESRGYLEKGSLDKVSPGVKDDIASLIVKQITLLRQNSSSTPEKTDDTTERRSEFKNLPDAVVKRRQAAYALIQQLCSLKMETLLKEKRSLTEETLSTLIQELYSEVENIFSLGIPLQFPYQTLQRNINPISPEDGLVYLSRYLNVEKDQDSERVEEVDYILDLNNAFQQRFGQEAWILNQQARDLFLLLLIETGRNKDTSTYKDFVINAKEEDIEELLIKLGLKTS